MSYTKSEQETVLVFDYEENVWNVYSTVPKHIRKLMNIGDMVIKEEEEGRPISISGILSEKQVSMKKPRVFTEEQKEELKLRGKVLAGKKKVN